MISLFKNVICGLSAVMLAAGTSWASCGSASCPIDTTTTEATEKGTVRLDYIHEYIDQDQPKIGRHDASVGEIRGHHDEVFTLNEIRRITADAGLTDRLNLQLSLPFIHREHQHIHHHQGSDHIEAWDFSGMGDLTLLLRYAIMQGGESRPRVSIIAGGILPTGRTRALNAEGDEAEPGILPGKQASSLILGGSCSRYFTARTLNGLYAELPVFFSSTYQWNSQGRDDYKIGNTWLANLGFVYPVLQNIGVMAQSNLRVSRPDDQGVTSEEVEKTGGTYVYMSPGIQLTMTENLWSYIYAQFPIYQRVNVIQLTSNSNLIAGLSYRFSAL